MQKTPIKVLLVEDDPAFLELITDVLKSSPHDVFVVHQETTLAGARNWLDRSAADVILLDLSLPDSAGLKTLREVRERANQIPIILFSGSDDEKTAMQAVRKGAQDYLVKSELSASMILRVIHYAIQRRSFERELEKEKYLAESLMDNIPDHIYFKDRESRFLRINRQMASIFGVDDPNLVIGKSDFDFFTKEHAQQAYNDEQEIIRTGEPLVNIEEKETWPDGRETWVSSTKVPLRDRDGNIIGTFGISRDITERKMNIERLRQANEKLARSEATLLGTLGDLKQTQTHLIETEKMQSIGTLAAGVAHEVKNPLAIILMGVDYLSRHIPAGDKTSGQVLEDISRAIRRADHIIRGMVDFSAARELELKPANLNTVLTDSLLLIHHEQKRAGITVKLQLEKPLPKIRIDKNKMEQVFINLFMNAIHAMPGGGSIHVRTKQDEIRETLDDSGIRMGAVFHKGDKVLRVEIEDTGPGIPEEKLAKVFNPFFTTKESGKGAGLGLTVCQRIIELHGGTIGIRNGNDKGVQITILLNLNTPQTS
jgi:PAS domain S-box-containing protein